MPIHEYRTADGQLVEKLFLPGDDIPDTISVDGHVARRTVSAPAVRFVGAFSGGTPSRYIRKPDDGSVLESGRKNDIKRRREEIEAANEKHRKDFVAEQLRTFDL